MTQLLPSSIVGRRIVVLSMGAFAASKVAGPQDTAECCFADLFITLESGDTLVLRPCSCFILLGDLVSRALSQPTKDALGCIGESLIDVVASKASEETLIILPGGLLLDNSSLPDGTRPNALHASEFEVDELTELYESLVSGRSGTLASLLE